MLQRSVGFGDYTETAWPQGRMELAAAGDIEQGAGWVLGAYSRIQLPPDVIDKVGGIEIVFGAEDPASLAGKTVGIRDRKFFVRD